MRFILVLCAAVLLAGGFALWRGTRSENRHGEFVGAPKTGVAALIADPRAYLGKTLAVEGEVREQCKTMGCHFFIAAGDKSLRIDLEPLMGSAPMFEGRPARVEGRLAPYGDGYQLVASAVEFR